MRKDAARKPSVRQSTLVIACARIIASLCSKAIADSHSQSIYFNVQDKPEPWCATRPRLTWMNAKNSARTLSEGVAMWCISMWNCKQWCAFRMHWCAAYEITKPKVLNIMVTVTVTARLLPGRHVDMSCDRGIHETCRHVLWQGDTRDM